MALLETEVSTIVNEVSFNTVDNLGVTPFFIKIDVEGAELEVLKSSLNVIKRYNPVILVEIQNHKSYQEIQELLASYGYINIELSRKSADSMNKVAMSKTSDFKEGTNNYVWINPVNPISWDFR
jgi:hypothetical protein